MSTRSAIIVQTATGYSGIYCHSDGYPSWNGTILQRHFNSPQAALDLVNLGDLSSIQLNGTAVAYHRDRGDEWDNVRPITAATSQEVANEIAHDRHVYLFENGRWFHNGNRLDRILRLPSIRADIESLAKDYPDLLPAQASPIDPRKALQLLANL